MTTAPNESMKTSQQEVQRLLGRCLLRLQQYERLIKVIVAHHELSGSAHGLEKILAARIADTSGKTLGTLVGNLLGSYVVTAEIDTPKAETASSPGDGPWFSIRASLELPDADFARITNELKELVHLRNNLVHHFIDQHDLWSLNGCSEANDALVTAYNRIDQHFEQLQEWADDMQKTRRQVAEYLLSDGCHEFMVNGIAPDGTVYWPSGGIVRSLREAAGELAIDGWTSVMAASRRIIEREPEQTPAKYGCSSWPQVLHESRVFEIRYFETDGQRSAWYRIKENSIN